MELPFLKKKSEAVAVPLVPAWHPNFRNAEKLPDIKPVRTAFFVNGAAGLVALVALTLVGIREYNLRSLNAQIAEFDVQIGRTKRSSELAVASFKKFQAEEAKVLEVDAFVKSKPVVSDLLLHIGNTLPKNIALDTFDLRDAGLSLRFTVRGSSETAGDRANAYLEQLRTDKSLTDKFDDFAITSFSRHATTGRLLVDLFLKFKTAPAKKP
ncbi:MAG: hypothetical protein RLZZ15_3883 [Verrucomicrobiota bacterium]|jgi:hypothetical protein